MYLTYCRIYKKILFIYYFFFLHIRRLYIAPNVTFASYLQISGAVTSAVMGICAVRA